MRDRKEIDADVAVVGGGIIGLSIAFELSLRGARVRVFDRDEPARAASWAAAGMLAPHTEMLEDAEFRELCADSLALYPEFVRSVATVGGIDPHLRLDGILSTAFTDVEMEHCAARWTTLRQRSVKAQILDREDVLRLEPSLASTVRGGVLVESEGQVDNRLLGRALLAACMARGVLVHAAASELAVECDDRRVLGVRSDRGFYPAQAVVNACGAWASQLSGIPIDSIVEVEPVKGQMIALQIPRGLIQRVLWVPGAYLVPRDDGRLLIGATVEDVGFDTRVTAKGVQSLLNAALLAAPALRDCALTETWSGVRPSTPSGVPQIGATGIAGYFVAVGHYRNGILLAPITAQRMADALSDQAVCA